MLYNKITYPLHPIDEDLWL